MSWRSSASRSLPWVHGIASRRWRAALELAKPGITLSTVLTAGAGLITGPPRGLGFACLVLAGVALTVASANAFNMWLERDSDARMQRTCNRPLPRGELRAGTALGIAVGYGAVGLGLLAPCSLLAASLAAAAIAVYAAIYTPLKRRSPAALFVGAVPGAMPPLIGAAAATGTITVAGLGLAAALFCWQVPHFIAIAVRRRDDYAQAGLRTIAEHRTDRQLRGLALGWGALLVAATAALGPLASISTAALLPAVAAAAMLVAAAVRPEPRWAKRVFLTSLAYLPLLLGAAAIDGVLDRLVALWA